MKKINKQKFSFIATSLLIASITIVAFQNCGSAIGTTSDGSDSSSTSVPGGTVTPPPPPPVTPPPTACPRTTNADPLVTAISQASVDFKIGMGRDAGTDSNKTLTANFTSGDTYSGIIDVNCNVVGGNSTGITVNCNTPNNAPSTGTFNITINADNEAECLSGPVTVNITVDDAVKTAQGAPITACNSIAKTSVRKSFIVNRIDACLPTQRVNPTVAYDAGQMGRTVATDGIWAIAAAPGDEERGVDAGAAYVMKKTGSTWAISQKLTPSNLTAGDLLTGAAISGSTLTLGAPLASNGSGRAWIYTFNGSSWVESKVLNPPSGGEGLFGSALAVSGSTVAISAPRANLGGGLYSGAVFKYTGSGWNSYDVFTPSGGVVARGEFGTSLSMSGATLAVGAPFPSSVTTRDEAVYIFTNSTLSKKISNPGTTNNAANRFGYALSLDGTNLVVGAPYNTNRRGSAYLYKSASGSFSDQPSLTYAMGDANRDDVDQFGFSVAVKGSRVLVGAPDKAEGSPKFGAVYLYGTAANTQLFKIRSRSDDRNADSFGYSIDVTADGWLVSGALNDEHNATVSNSGSLYFVKLP